MTVFAILFLTVLAFAFIAYPFLRQKSSSVVAAGDEQLQELHSRRDTTYAMLKELEFDKESGILSEDDYQELEARYKDKAISILRGIDDVGKGTEVEDEIENRVQKLRLEKSSSVDEEVEKDVLRLRRGKSSPGGKEVEKEVLGPRRSQYRFCSQCGAGSQERDRFCSRCGARLQGPKASRGKG